MFYFVYNILSLFLLLPVLLFNIYRAIKLGWPLATAERFGFVPQIKLANIKGRPVIWVHAVSVGEVIAARPLVKALRSRYHNHAIVVTTMTETGQTTAAGFPEVDLCLYFPFDFLPSVRAILDSVKPRIVIIMETEIWPNFSREAARRSIPLVLANGRISDRSFGRYLKFSWFFRPPLRCFSAICMQSEVGRERIIAIGADPEVTRVTGNLKNDIPTRQVSEEERLNLRQQYSIPEDCCVLTAGSTRDGEEPYIISTFRELSAKIGNLLLVLVPRHPVRAGEVARMLTDAGLSYQRRTALPEGTPLQSSEVLLVDTVGEMMNLYALADCAYVGGSLVPCGGHNLLEPASVGVPSVFGPYMANFREIEALVLHYGAGIQIQTPEELTATCQTLVTSPELRRVLGQNGLKLLRDNGGATERHMVIIAGYL
ncbi:MAG: 3-deoxy-D-manno-octulosonic acid transferase [Geobacteraceae bacterium GWC2_53_11]|nr:MAG: 3-deoxy-D-manno-octulosonic acid transferase [Geobacteraceae bacterium GWC2_53_11]